LQPARGVLRDVFDQGGLTSAGAIACDQDWIGKRGEDIVAGYDLDRFGAGFHNLKLANGTEILCGPMTALSIRAHQAWAAYHRDLIDNGVGLTPLRKH